MECVAFFKPYWYRLKWRVRMWKRRNKPIDLDSGRQPDFFPEHPPPDPHDILNNLEQYREAVVERVYAAEPGDRDDSLKSLYRLYGFVMLDNNIWIRNEIEYFYNHHDWKIVDIPAPHDPNRARQAMLAACVGLLAYAINSKIKIGCRRDSPPNQTMKQIERNKKAPRMWEAVPDWVRNADPVEETIKIPTHDGVTLSGMTDVRASPPFREKNILIWEPHVLFV